MRTCYECNFGDTEGNYITASGLCIGCAAFVVAYDCTPDCRARAQCTEAGVGHSLCGTCPACFLPKHHCSGGCEPYITTTEMED